VFVITALFVIPAKAGTQTKQQVGGVDTVMRIWLNSAPIQRPTVIGDPVWAPYLRRGDGLAAVERQNVETAGVSACRSFAPVGQEARAS
jgi:hypothetical protein